MRVLKNHVFGLANSGGRHVKRSELLKRISRFAIIALIAPMAIAAGAGAPAASANPSCANLSLVNGNFEATLPDPKPDYNYYWGNYTDASTNQVEGMGWLTTHPGNWLEFWAGDPLLTEDIGPIAFDGNTFVELNAGQESALYQDIATVPGTSIVWKLAHRAREASTPDDVNTMVVKIGATASITRINLDGGDNSMQQGPEITDGTYSWGVHTGIYVVPAGQTLTRFWFESLGGGSYGNFLDGISFMPYNCSSETPTYSPPTIAQTADGFTFQLTNYDPLGMTATASVGRASISSTGLVTLTGVPQNTASVVTVTNHHEGFIDASVQVNANSLGSALVPKFDTPVPTADGFTAQITNYNPSFTWTADTSDSSVAEVSPNGIVVVTGGPTVNTIVPVTTTKPAHLSGSAFVKITSVKLPTVVFNPAANNPGSSYEAAPIPVVQTPVKVLRKPVSVSVGGFKNGSSTLTPAMKSKIRKFIAAHSDYKSISIAGYTEGPTVLKRDYALSKQRALNALGFVKLSSIVQMKLSKISSAQEKKLGSNIRRVVISLKD